MPLELRRVHLMANYWVSLKGHNDNHPTKALLKECWENGRNIRENFGRIGNKIAEDLDIINVRLSPTVVFPALAPWKMIWPEVFVCLFVFLFGSPLASTVWLLVFLGPIKVLKHMYS